TGCRRDHNSASGRDKSAAAADLHERAFHARDMRGETVLALEYPAAAGAETRHQVAVLVDHADIAGERLPVIDRRQQPGLAVADGFRDWPKAAREHAFAEGK